MIRVARFNLSAPSPTVWTSLRLFSGTRILVAALLLLSVLTSDGKAFESDVVRQQCVAMVLAYGFMAILILPLSLRLQRRFYSLLLGQVTLDLIVLGWLVSITAGLKSGLGLLFLLPIAGAAALSPLMLALTVAALSTFGVLLDAWLRTLNDISTDQSLLMLAGLNGFLFFVTAVFVNRVAHRLITQEELVRERELRIQQQLEVNRLIIGDMDDGVIVLDEAEKIIAVNPAAQMILGGRGDPSEAEAIAVLPRWQKVWAECVRHREARPGLEAPTLFRANAVLDFADELPQSPRVQLRFLSSASVSKSVSELVKDLARTRQQIRAVPNGLVIVLEDLSQVEQRAQQLKLASLGRLSASIAHEVRNPLSAIRHASALLAEDSQSPTHERLTRIIEVNSLRINRIIEDVLQISRREEAHTERLALSPFIHNLLLEYQRDQQVLAGRIQLEVLVEADFLIEFDGAHLRRVLLNLLNNACRYATQQVGAIRIWVGTPDHTLQIGVANDGPPLTPAQQAHLFEPFYTTEAQGTGLGLFLSRELCEANGAQLSYDPQPAWLRLRYSRTETQSPTEPDGQTFSGAFVITVPLPMSGVASAGSFVSSIH